MSNLRDHVTKIRSKNAGPFWVTIDIFCGSAETYAWCCGILDTNAVAALYQTPAKDVLRFDIAALNVIKFSFPRPTIQGALQDRDMHGAAWATLLETLEVERS